MIREQKIKIIDLIIEDYKNNPFINLGMCTLFYKYCKDIYRPYGFISTTEWALLTNMFFWFKPRSCRSGTYWWPLSVSEERIKYLLLLRNVIEFDGTFFNICCGMYISEHGNEIKTKTLMSHSRLIYKTYGAYWGTFKNVRSDLIKIAAYKQGESFLYKDETFISFEILDNLSDKEIADILRDVMQKVLDAYNLNENKF